MGHKTNLNKLYKIKVIQNMFSDHNGIKINIKNKKKILGEFPSTWKLDNTLQNNPWSKRKSQGKIKNILR